MTTVYSAALVGLAPVPISIDVDAGGGKGAAFVIVGLPDAAIRESRDRVRTAIRNSGYEMPRRRIVVGLSPADLRKQGPAYDLPIALGILAATGQMPAAPLRDLLVVGELSLAGSTRPVAGCLPVAAGVDRSRFRGLVVPRANGAEAALAQRLPVFAVRSLVEAVEFLAGDLPIEPSLPDPPGADSTPVPDLADVRGQEAAKRALTIAAAGEHHLLLTGPPGTGKTMLARRLPGLLPSPGPDEILEATAIRSVSGLGPWAPSSARPFRAPHHTVSSAGLLGGGPAAAPGEISLAHTGVLLLDELPEFDRRTLNGLRQPLESGRITIRRVSYHVTYPARVLLVGAMNPCPCGRHGDGTGACRCTPREVERYRGRVSGPLLDRIDVRLEVPRVPYADLAGNASGPGTTELREEAVRARDIQTERLRPHGIGTNSRIPARLLRRLCERSPEAERVLEQAVDRLSLSARAHARTLRVARTIADLDGAGRIEDRHVHEALFVRGSTAPGAPFSLRQGVRSR